MPKIFISYRRDDSQYVTDSIYDHLTRHFGAGNVFLDVGSIPFGVDFRQYLYDQINGHDAVLVIVGPEWARHLRERADQPDDFVRIEIENALKLDKLVIPVLVMGASMPDFVDLPETIQDLKWRNSAIVRRQPDLPGDCARLAEGIQVYFASKGLTSALPTPDAAARSTKDILPAPFDWVQIPSGAVVITDGQTLGSRGRPYDVPAFDIAKYPITNAQYAQFTKEQGYHNKLWWTEPGWALREREQWTRPRYWDQPHLSGLNQPVVGVTWFEAQAYCRWLSESTGENTALPTEQQWQRAAEGDERNMYPWGNTWDCTRCNNAVAPCTSSSTTPVDHYEGVGDSMFGVVDMAGNVWEWCRTEYSYPAKGAVESYERVMRGGSWLNIQEYFFQSGIRFRSNPDNWAMMRGFRIVRE